MSNSILIPTPKSFNFRHAVGGHGWYDLPPFKYDEARGRLDYVYFSPITRRPEPVTVANGSGTIEAVGQGVDDVWYVLSPDGQPIV